MAKGISPPFGGSVTETTQVQKGGDGAKLGSQEAGYGGKGGKLRVSRISLFKKKPYDRPPLPPSTLDRPSSSVQGGDLPSLPARIVDSASSFLTSSASYLFESFFKRRQTLWIGNGSTRTAGRGSTDAQQTEELKSLTNKPVEHMSAPMEASLKTVTVKKLGNNDTGFMEVEEFLKRQSLSRDEVKRLTEALQTCSSEGIDINSNLEVLRRPEMVEQIGEHSNPVQLAKAFMGGRITQQRQSMPRHTEVTYPSLGTEGLHGRSLADASRGRSAPGASVRMLKRRLIGDDDDVVPTGPTRRVRQKMTPMTNTSPYIRQVTTASERLRTPTVPILQTSEIAQRIPELLEEPAVPSKGKSVEELPMVTSPNYIEDLPESSKARDGPSYTEDLLESSRDGPSHTEDLPESSKARNNVLVRNEECSVLPTSTAPVEFSCNLPEPVALGTLDKSSLGSIPASISELPVISPVKNRGFRISAFFEDSSSDEEADLPAKPLAPIETQPSRLLIAKEAEDASMPKQPSAAASHELPRSSAADSANIPVPILLQPTNTTGPSNAKSDTGPEVSSAHLSQSAVTVSASEGSTFSFPSLKPSPVFSFVPPATAKDGETSVAMSTRVPLFVSSSVSLSSLPLGAPTPLPSMSANEASLSQSKPEEATAAVLPLTSTNVPGKATSQLKFKAADTGAPETSGLFSVTSPQPDAVSAGSVTPSIAVSTVFPNLKVEAAAAEVSATSISPSGIGLLSTTPAAMPVANQGMNVTQPIIATAADSSLEAGIIKPSSTFESPSTDNRHGDLDTMATDPMSEEPDSSTVSLSAPAFSFGSSCSSTISVPAGETSAFGSQAALSPFSLSMQSSSLSGVSSSAESPFNSQSSSASGQLFAFGSAGLSPANPFSASSQATFSFGSSAATASMFTVTSSAPSGFPATSPAPSGFLFGAQASSSSSANSTSGFGGQTTPSASVFTSAGVQNNTPAFPFQASPTTPTLPSFQFGGASAGTSSMASNPSFGGQNFSFVGGQPANTPANPFTASGGSAGQFQFGATAAISTQPAFSSGASSAATFSFGAQPAPSPFPFTFGGQPTAVPTGQPFGFGGQPAAVSQNPFNTPASTGQSPSGASGMEFAGGFSLGAAGGEKAGRKFIKAKRIGGAKRGK